MEAQPKLFETDRKGRPDPTQPERTCALCGRPLLLTRAGVNRHRNGEGRLCAQELRQRAATWRQRKGGRS